MLERPRVLEIGEALRPTPRQVDSILAAMPPGTWRTIDEILKQAGIERSIVKTFLRYLRNAKPDGFGGSISNLGRRLEYLVTYPAGYKPEPKATPKPEPKPTLATVLAVRGVLERSEIPRFRGFVTIPKSCGIRETVNPLLPGDTYSLMAEGIGVEVMQAFEFACDCGWLAHCEPEADECPTCGDPFSTWGSSQRVFAGVHRSWSAFGQRWRV
jgi:hypothetical protein